MNDRVAGKGVFRIIGCQARVPLVRPGPDQAIIDFVSGLD